MTQDEKTWQEVFEEGKYAILVLKDDKIVHSVLYPSPPSIEDKTSLREELATDEEFGLMDEKNLIFKELDEELTEKWKKFITDDVEAESRGS